MAENKPDKKSNRGEKTPIKREPRQRKMSRRRYWTFRIIAVIGSIFFAYYACEAYYRFGIYRRNAAGNVPLFAVTELPYNEFDEDVGFKYRANVTTRNLAYSGRSGRAAPPHENNLHFNNMGHVSTRDDALEKPEKEYRIAVLGDSYTACLEMNVPWPDRLESQLNQDSFLKEKLDVSSFKVINFGRDGIGIQQCARIFEHEVTDYDVDMVILNFIPDDVFRKVVYRRTDHHEIDGVKYSVSIQSYSEHPNRFEKRWGSGLGAISLSFDDFRDMDKRDRLTKDIGRLLNQRVNWLSLYPDLLANKTGWFAPKVLNYYNHGLYDDVYAALDDCIEACRHIKQASRDALFLSVPSQMAEVNGSVSGVVFELHQRAPDLQVTPMFYYLPKATIFEATQWFIPDDGHMNDVGGEIYATGVRMRLHDHVQQRSVQRIWDQID